MTLPIADDTAPALAALLKPLGWTLRVKTRPNGRKYAYARRRQTREVEDVLYLGPLDDTPGLARHIAQLP